METYPLRYYAVWTDSSYCGLVNAWQEQAAYIITLLVLCEGNTLLFDS